MHQAGLLFEHFEQLAQRCHIGRQVSDTQQIALAGNHDIVCAVRHDIGASFNRRLHQTRHIVAQLAKFALQAYAHFVKAQSAKMLIQVVCCLDQLRWRVINIGQQQAILHIAAGRDDDQQDALFR